MPENNDGVAELAEPEAPVENDLCFMDTETLGLHPEAPVWEFAAIRRNAVDGTEQEFHCFIDHYPFPWVDDMPKQFLVDYRARYSPELALRQWDALSVIDKATRGATIVGAVPNFDTERLQRIRMRLRSGFGFEDLWHYHLVDVENLIVGYLRGIGATVPLPPWRSNDLSIAIGINPELFERHTAMGDVLWVRAQYDAIMADRP